MRRSHLLVVGSVVVALVTVGAASGRDVSGVVVLGIVYGGIAAWATLVGLTVDRETKLFPGFVAPSGKWTGALAEGEERVTTFRRPRLLVYGHYVTGGLPAVWCLWVTTAGLAGGAWGQAAFGALLTCAVAALLWDHVRRDRHGHVIVTSQRIIINLPGARAWSIAPGEVVSAAAEEATGLVSSVARRFTGKLGSVLVVTTETQPFVAARFGTFAAVEDIVYAVILASGPPYGHEDSEQADEADDPSNPWPRFLGETDAAPRRRSVGLSAEEFRRLSGDQAAQYLLDASHQERHRIVAEFAPKELYALLSNLPVDLRHELLDHLGVEYRAFADPIDPGCPN